MEIKRISYTISAIQTQTMLGHLTEYWCTESKIMGSNLIANPLFKRLCRNYISIGSFIEKIVDTYHSLLEEVLEVVAYIHLLLNIPDSAPYRTLEELYALLELICLRSHHMAGTD